MSQKSIGGCDATHRGPFHTPGLHYAASVQQRDVTPKLRAMALAWKTSGARVRSTQTDFNDTIFYISHTVKNNCFFHSVLAQMHRFWAETDWEMVSYHQIPCNRARNQEFLLFQKKTNRLNNHCTSGTHFGPHALKQYYDTGGKSQGTKRNIPRGIPPS